MKSVIAVNVNVSITALDRRRKVQVRYCLWYKSRTGRGHDWLTSTASTTMAPELRFSIVDTGHRYVTSVSVTVELSSALT